MGYAIAEAAEKRGAEVTLISGPVALDPPLGVALKKVMSAREMADAVLGAMDEMDIVIKVAAVADYRPADPKTNKIKKDPTLSSAGTAVDDDGTLRIDLVENPDILKMAGDRKKGQFLAGFAAETENLDRNALAKIRKKNLDMIVGNIVGVEHSGFEADTNKVTFFFKEGTSQDLPLTSKRAVAHTLLDHIVSRLGNGNGA